MQQNLPGSGGQQFDPSQQPTHASKRGLSSKSMVMPMLVIITILLLVNIFLTVSPPYLQQRNLTQQLIEEVSGKTEINPFETPVVSVVADADNLRKANSIQAQVYANAQNGDYVLGFSDKMIIYRRENGSIIYEGESPGVILNKNQQNLRDAIVNAAVSAGLIDSAEGANPQMSVVTDPAELQKQDPEFYADAKTGDLIAIFPEDQLILLIRSADGKATIIERGSYNTSIKQD